MKKTHWKKMQNPDYLGAYSLDTGNGYSDIVAKIKVVKVENITGADGKKEECVVAHLVGQKPMILNVTNLKMLEKLFKTPYIEDWSNRDIQVGVEKVKAFGETVDALRIRKFLPKTAETPKCADTGKEITATEKMTIAQIVTATQKRYGRPLCADRWMELVKSERVAETESEKTETEGAE